MTDLKSKIQKAAIILKNSKSAVAFTGAGISVESGIPPFRGETGLWSKYDPIVLDLNYFYSQPYESWKVIKEIFYDFFGEAKPNAAHVGLAELESQGLIKAILTQNIDNLHQEAGSKNVLEFHGHTRTLSCTDCGQIHDRNKVYEREVPLCNSCEGILKPDFIFFGEGIPEPAGSKSFEYGQKADVILVIGTTGEVMPACQIPYYTKRSGGTIIEINPEKSTFTDHITDIYSAGKASEVIAELVKEINSI